MPLGDSFLGLKAFCLSKGRLTISLESGPEKNCYRVLLIVTSFMCQKWKHFFPLQISRYHKVIYICSKI